MRNLLDKFDPRAEASLRHLIGGAVRTQAVYVAATLGIADKLALGPRSASELGAEAGADAATLRRVLRYLVSSGVFIEQDDGRFALNAAAEYLQSGHPRSLRPSAIRAGENLWNVAGRLLDAVKSGTTPHEELHESTFFETTNPQSFAARMAFSAADLGSAIAADECFAGARTVVDVGGGHGTHLASILQAHPRLRGILFDTAAMLAGAERTLDDVRDRCELVAGDFFQSVPEGDVYLLSWILHDWNDAKAEQILRACRRDGATLLIAEVLLPDHAQQIVESEAIADPFTLDMQMLLLTGGRERTLGEYRTLLDESGFALTSIRTPPSTRGASILTARPK